MVSDLYETQAQLWCSFYILLSFSDLVWSCVWWELHSASFYMLQEQPVGNVRVCDKNHIPPLKQRSRGAKAGGHPEQCPAQHLPGLATCRADTQQRQQEQLPPFGLRRQHCLWVMGHIVGCRGEAACGCTRLLMGCLGGEAKVRKWGDQSGLGRNKCGEKRGIRG